MNGVEILASEQVVTKYGLSGTAICTMLIVFIIAIIIGISCFSIRKRNWEDLLFCMFIGACISLLIGSVVQEETKVPLEYKTQYKVTISDEVLMNEFYDKYEIVEQDGKIFTVREKNDMLEE